MKILVANPNTSTGVTDRLIASAKLVASPGTELLPMTASYGVPYIATRAEAAIGAAAALEMLAQRRGEIDAAIVAAFGDPGLGGARELFDFPVVGMAEAAMLVACMLGRSFGIVSFSRSLEPWFAEIVAWHGLSGRCAAIRTLDESFRSIDEVQEEKEAVLVELAQRTVKENAADVVILAGAPLAGLANKIRDRVDVPRRWHPGRGRAGRRAGAHQAAQSCGRHLPPARTEGLEGARSGARRCDRAPWRVTFWATAARHPTRSGPAAPGWPCRSSPSSGSVALERGSPGPLRIHECGPRGPRSNKRYALVFGRTIFTVDVACTIRRPFSSRSSPSRKPTEPPQRRTRPSA
jgi:Asp/Glu/hydantoin racemase